MSDQPIRKHFYTAKCTLHFVGGPNQDALTHGENVLLQKDDTNITHKDLADIQKSAQIQLFQRMEDEQVNVVHLTMDSFFYLGHMTREEFFNLPQEPANG